MSEPAVNGAAVRLALDLAAVEQALSSSSTVLRIAYLNSVREQVAQSAFDRSKASSIVEALFKTHSSYYDRNSRTAVQKCLVAVLESGVDAPTLTPLVKKLRQESLKPAIAASSAFVLVEWCSILMQHLTTPLWHDLGHDILLADAAVLEQCLRSKTKRGLAHSAVIVTRRGFRKLLAPVDSGADKLQRAVRLLAATGNHSNAKHAPLLGIIAGVSSRQPTLRPVLEGLKLPYFEFYVKEIVGSKTALPDHISIGIADFFRSFCTLEDLNRDLAPAIEKGLLRAPEVVLSGVLTPLVLSIPARIDLASLLDTRLLKPLLSNAKSSNAAIRIGAVAAFRAIAPRCTEPRALDRVLDEIAAPLKSGKLSSGDQKIAYAEMIGAIPMSNTNAETAMIALSAAASKEGNEAALAAETCNLGTVCALNLRSNGGLPKTVLDTIAKGLAEKKPALRRLWLLAAGRILGAASEVDANAGSCSVVESLTPKLLDTLQEAVNVPSAAATNGLIVGAYIVAALVPAICAHFTSCSATSVSVKASILEQALSVGDKSSFLLNPRVYTKITAEEDLRWLNRALSSVVEHMRAKPHLDVALAWSEAIIYLITASSVPPQVRQEAAKELSRLYADRPRLVSELVITGLWNCVTQINSKEYTEKSERLNLVLRSITLDPEELASLGREVSQEDLEDQACRVLVLSRPELIPRSSWIDLCLRMKLDPGKLAQKREADLLGEIGLRTSLDQTSDIIKLAAYNAAAELAFVSPNTIIPQLLDLVSGDLDAEQLKRIGPLEAAIFRTPEGTAVVDILAHKSKNAVPNKNDKDYNILKWEGELRSQLDKKKGQQRKLTAEEISKVNAQLKKESEIRKSIRQVESRLLRGIGIIRSLAVGPPTEAILWLGSAVKLLLNIMDGGAGLVIGDAAAMTYITCSEKAASWLGSFRTLIGVATLRLKGIRLTDKHKQGSVEELVTRVLYRLRFSGEQRPLDAATLAYSLPLLLDVLHRGGIGPSEDDREAQLVLALEFLTFHTDACAEEALPRSQLLTVLIQSMQDHAQHYKLIKDCFTDVCRCIAPNISRQELQILARGAIVPQSGVRTTVLQVISAEIDMSEIGYSSEIWLACHDDVADNQELGREIWEESEFSTDSDTPLKMLPYLESKDGQLRRAAARSLAEAAKIYNGSLSELLARLSSTYKDLAMPRVQLLDEFGMPKKMDLSDPWEGRHGIATAYKELSLILTAEQLDNLFDFLIEGGPLGDKNASVRDEMLDAATKAIEAQGAALVDELMMKFERTLERPDKNSETDDRVNEAVIIMYGALARHLKAGDAKIPVVIERLLATLSTPSETVQYAIAECLPPLVQSCPEKSSEYLQRVQEELFTSQKYANQRGAAYGLAGLIRGRGIGAIRELRLISTLRSAMENKKEPHQREAALLAVELLSTILRRLFEPYVIQIVPQMLSGFGDSNADVRDACLAAAKACFGKLSSYGVKQIMPTLLEGLDDQQWRSKRGACDLLGAMAYLDPEQLATSLPDIIPPLTGVLSDSHKEVRAAANRSLKRFGEVISNPEIKSLVDVLLKALSDPTRYTDEALDSLIKVQFVHYLDAPSLALVTRVLQRGLGDRSSTKRKAAQVIGSLAHLTEKKDIIVHLPILVSGLKVAAVDPVPTTRATASRALGSLVEKLGEDTLPDLIPGLMQTLRSDTGAGDRLGSAQALSEVLAGLGTTRLEETLPTILQNVESAKPAVREGFMSLFIFLPVCFGNSFSNYLGRIVPPILSGLADDVESIRETALRAGRLLVKNFAVRAVDLLLPELERGLADDSYRIRLSSVELVGDLLFNLIGVKANAEADGEEDEEVVKETGASLKEVLGEEKRNKILSALYVCRCDTSGAVRSAAISVWKVLVHSPRTLKELVPTLSQLLIRRLGSSNMEHKVIASNALGELIRKAGDGVLASLLPTLEEGLQTSTDTDAKQGICLALRELISSATPEALEDHERTLISVVRTALIDSDDEVRETAAEAFDSLQQIIGKRAVDQVLPYLLNLLRSEDKAENALSALLTLLTETTRSNIILPNLIPTLTTPPISAFDAKALASLSKVAGAAMNRRLPGIIKSLLENEIQCKEEELRGELETSFDTVIQSIDEQDSLNTVMNVLIGLLKHEDHQKRAATARHMRSFFCAGTLDYSRYNQDIVHALLTLFDDGDMDVVESAMSALTEFTKKLPKDEIAALAVSTRQVLQLVGVPGTNLRGFELPKGINAILPIFLQSLMNGTIEQRVQGALGIADTVDRSSEASLKPFVTQITGPLIRVVSERATEVKAAILLTLNLLLEKMPTALKPFLPQLQRTFAKCLADPSSEVLRIRAANALGTLIKYTPRIDPLVAELVTGSKTPDNGVRSAMLKALYEVISKAGANMGDASLSAVLSLIDMDPSECDTDLSITNAKLLGALVKNIPEEPRNSLLRHRVVTTHFSSSSALALNAVLAESPDILMETGLLDELPDLLCQGMAHKTATIANNYILATGKLMLSSQPKTFEPAKRLFETLAKIIQPGNAGDSRRLAIVIVRTVSRRDMDMVRPHVAILAQPVFASVRDTVIPIKLAAEAAFVEMFSVVDAGSKVFDKYLAGAGDTLPPNTKRSMKDYFKRIATRLGAQAKERREAEGGQGGLGLSNDEVEDEREIWSVGKMEAGNITFD